MVCACRDCWCVAIGNSHNDDERCVLAGYDNGDVKMFDLRTNKVRGGCVRRALSWPLLAASVVRGTQKSRLRHCDVL